MGDLRAVRYRIDADRVLTIAPQGGDFHSAIEIIPSETETRAWSAKSTARFLNP